MDEREDTEQPAPRGPGLPGPLGGVPGLARLAGSTYLRGAGWALETYANASRRVARAVRDRENPADLAQEARDEWVSSVRRILGVDDLEQRVHDTRVENPDGSKRPATLRDRANDLLMRSADVGPQDDIHPAYEYVIEQMAPDEARILRLLVDSGPQPMVDVHTVAPLGRGMKRVARWLSMIGENAGLRHPERLNVYLDNLLRLGIVRISGTPVPDSTAYDVLEAQPRVHDALADARTGAGSVARVAQRSLRLTEFGQGFAEACRVG